MIAKVRKIKTVACAGVVAVILLSSASAMAWVVTGVATASTVLPVTQISCLTMVTPVHWLICAGGWTAIGIAWLPFWP